MGFADPLGYYFIRDSNEELHIEKAILSDDTMWDWIKSLCKNNVNYKIFPAISAPIAVWIDSEDDNDNESTGSKDEEVAQAIWDNATRQQRDKWTLQTIWHDNNINTSQ